MSKSSREAVQRYRDRLSTAGVARFEVIGRTEDRALIRTLARRLAEPSAQADALRLAVSQYVETVAESPSETRPTGGILRALRNSPLVGSDIDLTRVPHSGRDAGL